MKLPNWRFLLAGAVLLAAQPALGQAPGGAPPKVTVAKPVVREVVEYDEFTGRFAAVDSVDVRARVTGYLEKVGFADGADVNKDDVLFVIDRRPYKAALDQATASVASAQARLVFAQTDYERANSLQKTGNISDQTVDQRRQAFVSARADLDSAQGALRNAQLNYDFTEVRAPISGRISRRNISVGNLVNANDTLLTNIVSTDPIYFYFDVDERSYLAFARQMLVESQAGRAMMSSALVGVTDESEPTRPARIDFRNNAIDRASGTLQVRLIVDNKDRFLVPGLFGRTRIPSSPPHQGILIPDEAVATDLDRRFVWTVAADGSVAAKSVRLGPKIDGYRLVREGLDGTETIVINGLQRVRPGGKVTPERQELPPTRS
ncbi:efflux RND transporter periplasmic adaptor subunit [Enterovirga sp.]|uniref:efflux RND transporter periplasmic adaptor subunit n=1 Tax=Enterovirga sp. TaxID=2026350 RepID=UPI002BF72B1D|nr:efflux RND transporter periplasmic adaptor subunit [Enterovirga sp.]HMO29666.1 efflux RND transporter periplasmic adaptor subunit [Enterovirga sp.]